MWISHTTLSYMLLTKVYVTYSAGVAFTNDTPLATPLLPAEVFMLILTPGWFSLRLDVYSPSQVLQTYGRFYHVDLASLLSEKLHIAGFLCSESVTSLHSSLEPIRHPLAFD